MPGGLPITDQRSTHRRWWRFGPHALASASKKDPGYLARRATPTPPPMSFLRSLSRFCLLPIASWRPRRTSYRYHSSFFRSVNDCLEAHGFTLLTVSLPLTNYWSNQFNTADEIRGALLCRPFRACVEGRHTQVSARSSLYPGLRSAAPPGLYHRAPIQAQILFALIRVHSRFNLIGWGYAAIGYDMPPPRGYEATSFASCCSARAIESCEE